VSPYTRVTCARCYSLRTSGKVKNAAAETLMPSFDFGRVVGTRLARLGRPGAAVAGGVLRTTSPPLNLLPIHCTLRASV
jgi:hypothetical protein